MPVDLAEDIAQMAAPIFAALLKRSMELKPENGMALPSDSDLEELRWLAIDQALELRKDALEELAHGEV